MTYFQTQLGKDLKREGLHYKYDPNTKEELRDGAYNPEGIKVAKNRKTGRVGITLAGDDKRRAVEYLRTRGCELIEHNDNFMEVGPPEFD